MYHFPIFSENLKKAVYWAKEQIFEHPYPYLTPWLVQSLPPEENMCPRQLECFEIALNNETDPYDGRIIVRPNHGMVHSLRVTSYIPLVCELFKKYSTDPEMQAIVNEEQEIEILQMMMLFSVSGRVNEAGSASFASMTREERQLNARNYEDSRKNSVENFRQYCQETQFIDTNSEKFEKIYAHALRYMESRNDRRHNWNKYIILMSLTHTMDLLRCFGPTSSITCCLHRYFEFYFKDHSTYHQDKNIVFKDIFKTLKYAETALYYTGNRIFTAIDVNEQRYSDSKYSTYDFNLFWRCTNDVDFTMNILTQYHPFTLKPKKALLYSSSNQTTEQKMTQGTTIQKKRSLTM